MQLINIVDEKHIFENSKTKDDFSEKSSSKNFKKIDVSEPTNSKNNKNENINKKFNKKFT